MQKDLFQMKMHLCAMYGASLAQNTTKNEVNIVTETGFILLKQFFISFLLDSQKTTVQCNIKPC